MTPSDSAILRGMLALSGDRVEILDLAGALVATITPGPEEAATPGQPWAELWPEEDRQAAAAAVAAAMAGGAGRFRAHHRPGAGGQRRWDVQVTRLHDSGEPRLLAVSRDVTSAWHAEEALRMAQSLNTPILNSSRDCIVVLDLEGRTLFVSPGGVEAMEVSDVPAILGLSWLRVWTGIDNQLAHEAVAQARSGRVGRFEGFCPTHKGTPKWWDVIITPLLGDDGLPERLVSVGRDITDRKLADEEARNLARLVEQSRDFMAVTDPDGQVQFVNHAGREMVGLPEPGAARGTALIDYFAPDDRWAVSTTVMPRLQRGGFWEGELNFRHFTTGQPQPVQLNIFPLRNRRGTLTGYGTVTRDLRDVRQSQARRIALLELGDGLRAMESIAAMASAAAGIIGRTLGVARAFYATLDANEAVFSVERDWAAPGLASIAGEHRMRDFGAPVETLRAGEPVIVNTTAQDPRITAAPQTPGSGSAQALVVLPLIENGALVACFFAIDAASRVWRPEEVGFVRNVAERTRSAIERKRAETGLQALAASLERQVVERTADRNRLWRLSTDIMVVMQYDGTTVAVNPAWTTMLGWAERDLVGRNLSDLVHPEDLEASLAAAQGLADDAALWRTASRCRAKDGSYRWITWSAVSGEGLINAVGRDVTAEKEQAEALQQAEERLRHSQKMEAVGQLTGGLAHDFNNLLTGITGSLEMLGTRLDQGRLDELGRYLAAAQGAARRAAALTHRLLAFSRRQTLDPKPTDVNRLVSDMQDLVSRTVGPGIGIEVVGAAGLWPALVDPNQLENALLNLCINARDAMPDGGRLTIETANKWLDERAARERELAPGQYLSLCVTDTGAGMTEEVRKRAFDPFFTTKPLGQGTGLGLSMIYGFAQQSGGQIRIYSELGQGTTMCLYLPRHHGAAAQEAGLPPLPEPAHAPRAEQGETVLIVDDEPTVRMLVTEILQDLGYTAIEAADGVEALRVLQSPVRIDLLVTDVGLPGGMNGRQVADAGRALRHGLTVLFITGYAENAVLGNGLLEPGMHVMTKPFAMEALATRIKHLIGDR